LGAQKRDTVPYEDEEEEYDEDEEYDDKERGDNDKKIFKFGLDDEIIILLYEYFILKILYTYITLTNKKEMLYKEEIDNEDGNDNNNDVDNEDGGDKYIEDVLISDLEYGNKEQLQIEIKELLVVYLTNMNETKKILNVSSTVINDKIFKLKEREKDTFTDRLKEMTEEERKVDTILKINKLGVWNKGLQKGLIIYDPENYDEERELMVKINAIENTLKTKGINDRSMNLEVEDIIEEEYNNDLIETEEYSMSKIGEDFWDGDPYGEENNYLDDE